MADLDRVRRWADALIRLHLDPAIWTFGFDRATTRAGLCDYARHRITVSKHLAARFEDDEVHQVLLHEVAHALAGPRAGHGAEWKRVAASLGYVGSRLHSGSVAEELAPWHGSCPAGHVHYRYRRPARLLSCARCSKRFDPAAVIVWSRRPEPDAVRRPGLPSRTRRSR